MFNLEIKGTKHIVVSISENLGNKTSYVQYSDEEKYSPANDNVISKIDSLADYGYETVKFQKCYKRVQNDNSNFLLYVWDGSTAVRIPFTIYQFKKSSIVIISNVFIKNSTRHETKEFKSSQKLINHSIKWIENNEKKFQDIIE